MSEIAIYITVPDAAAPMCEDPFIAQSVADEFNGPDSHCVKGDELGQWLIEEPALTDKNGIGKAMDINKIRVIVEDAYCFHGKEMPVKFLDRLPSEVIRSIIDCEKILA